MPATVNRFTVAGILYTSIKNSNNGWMAEADGVMTVFLLVTPGGATRAWAAQARWSTLPRRPT